MQPTFEMNVANLLPPATVLLLVSGIWSLYFFLHVLPQLQLSMPPSHYDSEALESNLFSKLFSRPSAKAMQLHDYLDPKVTKTLRQAVSATSARHAPQRESHADLQRDLLPALGISGRTCENDEK